MEIRPIAHIRTEFPEKFGIPRQSGLSPELTGFVVFEADFRVPAAVEGLEAKRVYGHKPVSRVQIPSTPPLSLMKQRAAMKVVALFSYRFRAKDFFGEQHG